MYENNDFIDKKLRLLLDDAVFFLEEALESRAQDSDNSNIKYRKLLRESAFTRTSVLNSALLLESAANCCIATLDISKALLSDIDKLRVINKFEYYLEHVNNDKKIDRGLSITQQVTELVSIRNSIVHPKPYKSEWVKIEDKTKIVDLGETQFLKLPNSFWMCKSHHAEIALKASLNFLSYYFCDLCQYREHEVWKIILGSNDGQDPQKWIEIYEKYGFNVSFLVNVQAVKEGEARLEEHLKTEAMRNNS